jgi:hypothetical protein
MALMAAHMLVGCQAGGLFGGASPSIDVSRFAYTVDPMIVGRYGTTGEVAWADAGAGHRPSISLLGEQMIAFNPGTPDSEVRRFTRDFSATIVRRYIMPGTPDGAIPPKETDTYLMIFNPAGVSLEGFRALGAQMMPGASLVFSSENAARIFYQLLRARQLGGAYSIQSVSINAMMCIPEACGPDGGPQPLFPSVAPPPTPAPTPTPELKPMALAAFDCGAPRPVGKMGIIRVTAIVEDGCWVPHEVRAVLNEETREVRLEGTQRRVAAGCTASPSRPELQAEFLPTLPGTYRVIGMVKSGDGSGEAREQACELVMTEGDFSGAR